MKTFASVAVLLSALAGPAAAGEMPSGPESRTALAVTIYNDGQALVKDSRRLDLAAGPNTIAFREVAARIRPETASLRSMGGAGFALVEQNFDFDLLTPDTLLRKYVGRQVTVIRTNPATGGESAERATVLATNEGVVLRYPDRIETGAAGRLSFDSVPASLRERPTLSVTVQAAKAGPQEAGLMYLTQGLGWKADYIATLDVDGKQMNLAGWVTLTNQSGTAYQGARLQLVAGTLNRVAEPRLAVAKAMAMPAPAPAREMREEKLFEYHLYTLDQPTTILDNQVKQVALLSAGAIPVSREYELQGAAWYYQGRYAEIGRKLKPSVFLSFENKGGELGKPLPQGTVRVYSRDSRGGAQLVGEDAIGHTAKGEKLRLRLGEAFDITADRVQTDYRSLPGNAWQSSFRVEIRNADPKPVTVRLVEPMPGDWKVTEQSHPHAKLSSGAAAWDVTVPGEGKAVLEYTTVARW
ncbi:MAG: DUF4139 domain-containing protein [Rhodocyclaceae bacterium]|nr:DUF4139 domain-containing protein [Rhodocyclaceae bacterium]